VVADQMTVDSLANKFQTWAESLSPAEQTALAEWIADLAGVDVSAHWDSNWWEQPGAWSRAWAAGWKSE
jgi:Tfp pilus assembly protein FimT